MRGRRAGGPWSFRQQTGPVFLAIDSGSVKGRPQAQVTGSSLLPGVSNFPIFQAELWTYQLVCGVWSTPLAARWIREVIAANVDQSQSASHATIASS